MRRFFGEDRHVDPQYALTVTAQPTAEPVTLAQAKSHLRVDTADEDDEITQAIVAARKYAEGHSGHFFLAQTVRMKLARWPHDQVIRLTPFGPNEITAITAFTYYDTTGTQQTLTADRYQAEFACNPPIVTPPPLSFWPWHQWGRIFPIEIDLAVGVADATTLDARVGQAIKLTLGYWYMDRGDGNLAAVAESLGLPVGAKRLLDQIWTGAYG